MRKRTLGRLSFFCVLMMLCAVGCSNDIEKELETIEKKGYTAEIVTKYNVEDVAEYCTVSIYSENREIKEVQFDEEGKERGYTLIEYNSSGQRMKDVDYNAKNKSIGYAEYEYDERKNVIVKHIYEGEMEFVYRYRYDEQNRMISKAEDVGEGTTQAVFYTTLYFYDEEGRLSREEIFATDELHSYVEYEYEGEVLLKKEKYKIGKKSNYLQEGIEYVYDIDGRLVKSVYYNEPHECISYMVYEYR